MISRSGQRSGAWLKFRINRGQEFVIGGYVSGNPLDSIIVGYSQDGTLLYAAKVRNGFAPHTRRAVAAKLKGREIATCPFANPPERKRTQWALTKEEMKLHMGKARSGGTNQVLPSGRRMRIYGAPVSSAGGTTKTRVTWCGRANCKALRRPNLLTLSSAYNGSIVFDFFVAAAVYNPGNTVAARPST